LVWESARVSIEESHDLELDWALSWELDWWTLSKFLHSVLPFLELVKVASCRVVSSHTQAVVGRWSPLPADHH
jgi:hypothetical protein